MTLYPRNLVMIVRAQRQMLQDISGLQYLRMTGLGLYYYLLGVALGVAAEVCREIGVVDWLDQQDLRIRQPVSVGSATVALVLNGYGFSNHWLSQVQQLSAAGVVEWL